MRQAIFIPYRNSMKLIIKIEWADLDLFGHVNNVAFFRYMQSARVNLCEHIGLSSINELEPSFMVASSKCEFKKPLRYPGSVTIMSEVKWIKNTSFSIGHDLMNDSGEQCAGGEDILVLFDHLNGTKLSFSHELRERIASIDKRKPKAK